jgi:hypothetical protein
MIFCFLFCQNYMPFANFWQDSELNFFGLYKAKNDTLIKKPSSVRGKKVLIFYFFLIGVVAGNLETGYVVLGHGMAAVRMGQRSAAVTAGINSFGMGKTLSVKTVWHHAGGVRTAGLAGLACAAGVSRGQSR